MSDQFEFFKLDASHEKQWDDFVLKNTNGSIHQTYDWKGFQTQIPGREQVFGFGVKAKKSADFLATVLCVQMNTGFQNKSWYYSARGPVFENKHHAAAKYLLEKSADFLQKQDALFWRLDPYNSLPDIKTVPAGQQYQPTDTLELDLTQSNDQLLADMKRKGRYNINLATKKGITFSHITGTEFSKLNEKKSADFLDAFWKLNQDTTGRDGFSGHEKSYYKKFLSSLGDKVVLFFAEYEGKKIATAISTFCGTKAIYYFGASTSDREYRKLMAPYGLQWHMIQYAKEKNCTSYDFLGIAPENEPNHAYAGISDFKWKFGGSRKTYPAAQEIVFQKFWYTLYRLAKKFR